MQPLKEHLTSIDWNAIRVCLNEKGFVLIPSVLQKDLCDEIISMYSGEAYKFRKTVVMERHRFGKGEYKYFEYPLPEPILLMRETVYSELVPVANAWMENLNISTQFPPEHRQLLERCHKTLQVKPTVLLLKYGHGGFNTLHQDLYGEVYFPFQIVLFLNEPESDYTGGEFVLTEQVPRAQSKAIVLQPKHGDMLIFTTNFRPIKGTRGFYRANMKHGVSAVHTGRRHTLGIIFHDAVS